MSTLLGDARVRIRPDAGGFQAEAKRSVLGPLKSIAIAAGAAFAAAGIGNALKGAITEASDLGESLNALNVVYGDSSKGIQDLGKAAATSLGLSNVEFNNLAVRFSAFSKTIAGDGGDVVGTLDELTTRASDFASVMNLDVSAAAQLFQSGLAGESEPLRAYGIDLSAASVEAHALAVGIGDGTGALTESEKVQARYSSIMAQTAQVTGDFSNTSDSLANSQRILSARFSDVKAGIGAALLPALETGVGFMLDHGLPAVEGFTDGVKNLYNTVMYGGSVQAEDGSWVPASFYGEGNDLLDMVGSIRNYDWAGVATVISDGLSNIGPAITGAFADADVDFRVIADDLRDGLVDAFGELPQDIRAAVAAGDWAGVGEIIGTAFAGGINTIVTASDAIGDALFAVIESAIVAVNWPELAMAFGKIAPAIGLGFLTGLLNFDMGAIFTFIGDNWVAVLVGVLTTLFAPAKFVGVFGRILAKIPFVGAFLERALLAFNTFGREKVWPFISRFLGNIATGFRSGGPGTIGKAVSDVFGGVALRLFVWADDLLIWFRALPGRMSLWANDLGLKIGQYFRLFVDDIFATVGRMFSGAAGMFATGVRALVAKFAELFPNATRVMSDLAVALPRMAGNLLGSVQTAFRVGVAAISAVFLGLVSTILTGASEAFSWVPGIGDKLDDASKAFKTFKENVNASIRGIDEERKIAIRAELNATAAALVKSGATPTQAKQRVSQTLRAAGGAIHGPGTGTSDSIQAIGPDGLPSYRLSNGEHVWTAKEVAAAGGHGAMLAMRQQYRAKGGPVELGSVSRQRWEQLKSQGWKGIAGDNAERLYSPATRASLTGRGVHPRADVANTDNFDQLAVQLNAGATALGKAMQGTVDTLAASARTAAAAAISDAGGPLPAISKAGWMRPGRGGTVTSEFGNRRHPLTGRTKLHNGIDVAGLMGSRVLAAQAGRVRFAGRMGSYGNVVFVRHGGGLGETGYAHLNGINVRVGQQVARGALVGMEGATGGVTGKHLHFNWNRSGWKNPRGMGVFDNGGIARGTGAMVKDVIAPERTLNPRQTVAFEKWMDHGAPSSNGGTTVVNVYIDGEQLDARTEVLIDGVLADAARGSTRATYARTGGA